MIRYIHKGKFPLDNGRPQCKLCGSTYGYTTATDSLSQATRTLDVCDATRCLNCGTRQCMSNGLGSGSCSICLTGMLIGWSGDKRKCGHKTCPNRAVARAPRVGFACRVHVFEEPNLLDRRNLQFVAYDDRGYVFREVANDPEVFRQARLFIPEG